jgi:hypothetical protein
MAITAASGNSGKITTISGDQRPPTPNTPEQPTMSQSHTSNLGQDLRMLTADELDAVSGGNDNGCIRLPTIIIHQPQDPKPMVDIFAKWHIG